ncbi:TPA: phage tail protein [Aeromonas hydrophila]
MYLFIDDADLAAVIDQFAGLDQKVISLAFHRAMKRTEQSVMSQSRKVLQQELELRNQKSMKARVRTYIRPAASDMAEMKFWFGMNDLSPNAFKGTPKQTRGGLMFRGSYYDKAFVSLRKGRKVFMQRETDMRYPITKLTIPIPDDIVVKIEDEVLERMPDIFMRHFETDLRGRSKSSQWASVFGSGQHGSLDKAVTNIMNPGRKAPRGAR